MRTRLPLATGLVALCTTLCGLEPPADFSIVVLPDTQKYTVSDAAMAGFTAQMRWIAEQREARRIRFVTHLGDIVETGSEAEYRRARAALDPLRGSGLPYALLPGNHEGYGPGNYRYSTATLAHFDRWFPAADMAGRPWFGGGFPDGTLRNSYQLFSAEGMDFIHLSLAYQGADVEEVKQHNFGVNDPGVDDAALAWADGVLTRHAGRRAIISTHNYLSGDGRRTHDGERIWQRLVRRHPDVFLVLCGHHVREAMRISRNDAGRTVHELLSDYQGDPAGGNGWLRILRFVPRLDIIEVRTLSPLLGEEETDANSCFDLQYAMASAMHPDDRAPAVEAGPDPPGAWPAQGVLEGTAADPDGDRLAIAWSQVSGPAPAAIADAGSLRTTVGFTRAGAYVFRLVADDGRLAAADLVRIEVVQVVPRGPGHGISWERFDGIKGAKVADLLAHPSFAGEPSARGVIAGPDGGLAFEGRRDDYGARLRGFFIAPVSGEYRFQLCADDAAELHLSTDEDPARKRPIARVERWQPRGTWRNGSERSEAIALAAGRRYYIEVLQKEDFGDDHLQVGVEMPEGAIERPIPWHRLDPWTAAP